jgi:hypothetical protein
MYYICVLKLIHNNDMKTFKIDGTITHFEVETKQSKGGKDYDTGYFLLADEDGAVFKFDVWGKLASRFGDELVVMDVVSVEFGIDVRDWNGKYFTNLKAQGIVMNGARSGGAKKAAVKESVTASSMAAAATDGLPLSGFEKGSFIDDDGSEELPF